MAFKKLKTACLLLRRPFCELFRLGGGLRIVVAGQPGHLFDALSRFAVHVLDIPGFVESLKERFESRGLKG